MLLLLRPAGTWEPPAGRLQPGESLEEGATRELYEETGMLISPGRIIATWVGDAPSGRRLASITYAGRTGGGEVILSDEHLDYRWVTLEEWMALPSWWNRRDIQGVAESVKAVAAVREPPQKPPLPPLEREDAGVVPANLGAGVVLVDLDGVGPRALLLRRRKPPIGLWENPGGMLEEGEDFVACAGRELYAGVGFLARHPGDGIEPETAAHDAFIWATETEWRSLRTWYTERESDVLWTAIKEMQR